jgi:8-amino-7-oxononanoate synthase
VIVSDGLFSADGNLCRLRDIVGLAEQHEAIVVLDSAHDLGAFGPGGLGISGAEGLMNKIDLIVGTMSKAYGSTGGFVVGREDTIIKLKHRSAPFHSSRTFSPGVAGASLESLRIVQGEGEAQRATLTANANCLREMLRAHDFDTLTTESYIVPVVLGNTEHTLRTANWLQANGILAAPFIFPTVPRSKERLRLGVTTSHTADDMSLLVAALRAARSALK